MTGKNKNQANILAKECIVEALIELLEEKPFSAITISELTAKAGVSRMTYYRNYNKKEDIFEQYLSDAIDYYGEDVQELMLKGNYYDRENLIHCFVYLKKHRRFLNCLLNNGFGDLLRITICDYVLQTWYRAEDGKDHYYKLQAFAGALYNLYIAWSMEDMKESPEELAELISTMC